LTFLNFILKTIFCSK